MAVAAPRSPIPQTAHGVTSFTESAPSTLAVGDLMLFWIAYNAASGLNVPSGWTQIVNIQATSATVGLWVGKKIAVAGDIGATYTASLTAQAKSATIITAYPGGTDTGEVEIAQDASSVNHVAPALASMLAGSTSWAVSGHAERSSTNTSWSTPASSTQRVALLGSGGGAVSMAVEDSNAGTSTWAAKTSVASIAAAGVDCSIELLAGSAVVTPGVPTGVIAAAGSGQATVTFVPGSTGGGTVTYTVVDTNGGLQATGSGSPIVIAGLPNGVADTVKVKATNSAGTSALSAASGSFTPLAATTLRRGWGIRVGPIQKIQVAPTPGPVLGIAPPSQSQAQWDATAGVAGPAVKLYRYYNTGVPTSWATSAGAINGPTQYIYSFKPNIAQVIAGTLDATLTAIAKFIPAGAYVTCQHEPEQANKNISPAQFGQFFARVYSVMKAANPALKIGPIVMTYTSNARVTNPAVGHVIGHNEWLEQVLANGTTPDYVGFDGYQGSGNGTSIADIFTAPSALARGLWAAIPLVCAEFGYHTTGTPDTTVQQWMVDGFTTFKALGYSAIAWWDGTNFIIDNAELVTYGSLQ